MAVLGILSDDVPGLLFFIFYKFYFRTWLVNILFIKGFYIYDAFLSSISPIINPL